MNQKAFYLDESDRAALLTVAEDSLKQAAMKGNALEVELSQFSPRLRQNGAAFVTLNKKGQLRGCIGSLMAWRPLVEDVAENALASALRDPRFPPVSENELAEIDIHISVLTPPEAMEVKDEQDLLNQLRPNEDGLILTCGNYRATFLPAVWEQLPRPEDFVRHLKLKAGMAQDFWSEGMRCERYGAISIP